MAEIDWDRIIKAAQTKRKEQIERKEGRKDIDKRLDRMERLLEKVASAKDRGTGVKGTKLDVGKPEHDAAYERGRAYKEDRRAKLERAGFKFVRVPRASRLRFSRPKITVPRISLPKAVANLSRRQKLAAMVAIIAVIAVGAASASGKLDFANMGLTGLISQPKTMYICWDGVTTVENITMCPTTTTTTTTTTTSTTTTTTVPTTTTTTLPTTTTTLGAKHSVAITESECSGNIITVKLKNTGPVIDNLVYVTFFIDDTKADTFLCSGGVLGPGEQTSCVSAMVSSGTHDVEARGLVNVAYATVTC